MEEKTDVFIICETDVATKVDDLFALRERIRDLDKQVKELKQERDSREVDIREAMKVELGGVASVSTDLATASLSSREFVVLEDYGKFERFVYANEALDCMQARPALRAIKDRMEETGIVVPGVSIQSVPTLNLRKR